MPCDKDIPRLLTAVCHERCHHLQEPELHQVVGAVKATMYLKSPVLSFLSEFIQNFIHTLTLELLGAIIVLAAYASKGFDSFETVEVTGKTARVIGHRSRS